MIELRSTLTCLHCGHRETETMPTDACQFFYNCKGCGAVLGPKPGIAAYSVRMGTSLARLSSKRAPAAIPVAPGSIFRESMRPG